MALFSAVGIGGMANVDGTITLRAQIVRNDTRQVMTQLTVKGESLFACTAQLQIELDAREAAEVDKTINLNVAGVVLATSRSPKEVAAAPAPDPGAEVLP